MTVVIFGIDVLSGGSPFSRNPRYALVVLEDEQVLERFPEINFFQLSKLISLYKPAILATDNVFELSSDIEGLRKFVSSVPSNLRLIQVTGAPPKQRGLQELAVEYGLPSPKRLNPLEEAEACARLAGKNAGAEVKLLEDETRITVTRNVSLGPGGSSQSRYRRSVHTSILRVTNSIKRVLERSGLDFDLFREKSDFGLDKGEFVVYAPRVKLAGLVRPFRGGSIRVSILPVYKEKIDFLSHYPTSLRDIQVGRKDHERRLIVGLDPGATCGIALLSFKGEVLHLKSQKGLSRGDLTRLLTDFGEAVIIATDVRPLPEFVKKFSATLRLVVFIPEYSLSVSEKQELAGEFSSKSGMEVRNLHERDALAAAAKAYRHYKNKFEQIEVFVSENPSMVAVDEVKTLVVRGYPIVKAFKALAKKSEISPPVEVTETKRLLTSEETQAPVKQLRAKVFDQSMLIEKLRGEIENLQRALTELGASRESLEKELSRKRSKEEMEIKKEREWFNLRRGVNNLQKQLQAKDVEIQGYLQRLELLKRVNLMKVREELLLLKPIDSFTTEGIDIASKLYNIKNGDAILLIDGRGGGASTALNLVNLGVRIVVSATPISHQAEETFIRGEVPVIPSGALELSWIEGLPYVDPSILRMVLKESIRSSGEEEAVQDLSKLVDEYKRDRSAVLQE